MQVDMHYYGTYAMARAAGLKPKAAQTIAYAAQYVDNSTAKEVDDHEDGSKIEAIATAHHPSDMRNIDRNHQRYIWVPFHFIPGGKGKTFTEKLVCRKNSNIAKEMVQYNLSQADKPFILELVGVTAHVYADTFAHYGFSGVSSRRNRVDGSSIRIENPSPLIENLIGKKLNEFFDHYGEQGGLIRNIRSMISGSAEIASGALGHGGVSVYPDQPYLKWKFDYEYADLTDKRSVRNNQKTYLEGAKNLYVMFRSFANANPEFKDDDGAKEFSVFEKELKKIFAMEANKKERINLWQEKAKEDIFYKASGRKIPTYSADSWHKQGHKFSMLKKSKDARKLDIYRFYQAASFHRHYVLKELLPKHGMIVI